MILLSFFLRDILVENFATIILAAGLGKRTGSKLPKVLIETIEARPLIAYVLKTIEETGTSRLSVIVGYEKDLVTNAVLKFSGKLPTADFCFQEQQRGTGDAVKAAKSSLENWQGPVIILCGDMPLVRAETLAKLLASHENSKATISLVTTSISYDNGFGRIVRDSQGNPFSIVERKDCSAAEVGISERNLGIYCVDSAFLFSALDRLENKNAQSEFYLTDIIKIAADEGQRVVAIPCSSPEEALGVNDLSDLMQVNEVVRKQRINDLARAGVKFLAPESVLIEADVKLASGVVIGPSVQISGNTSIAEGTVIEGTAIINNSKIGKNCLLRLGSYLNEAELEEDVKIGPFVQIRPGSKLGKNVAIGNFVELKNAQLAEGAKANHLTYLGDCEVGESSNIGAGTITCNYDGVKKSRTTIGKNVFIGSNTALVAPVTIGDGAVIGAGSVITKKVESEALALTRAPQISKTGWAKGRNKKKE